MSCGRPFKSGRPSRPPPLSPPSAAGHLRLAGQPAGGGAGHRARGAGRRDPDARCQEPIASVAGWRPSATEDAGAHLGAAAAAATLATAAAAAVVRPPGQPAPRAGARARAFAALRPALRQLVNNSGLQRFYLKRETILRANVWAYDPSSNSGILNIRSIQYILSSKVEILHQWNKPHTSDVWGRKLVRAILWGPLELQSQDCLWPKWSNPTK